MCYNIFDSINIHMLSLTRKPQNKEKELLTKFINMYQYVSKCSKIKQSRYIYVNYDIYCRTSLVFSSAYIKNEEINLDILLLEANILFACVLEVKRAQIGGSFPRSMYIIPALECISDIYVM